MFVCVGFECVCVCVCMYAKVVEVPVNKVSEHVCGAVFVCICVCMCIYIYII